MNLKPENNRGGFVPVLSREEPEEEVWVGSRVDIEETFGSSFSELGINYTYHGKFNCLDISINPEDDMWRTILYGICR